MLIGYMRVSTTEQNLDLQRDALEVAGCERIYEDVCSGRVVDRPGLTNALDVARDEDALVVWKLDREEELPRYIHLDDEGSCASACILPFAIYLNCKKF